MNIMHYLSMINKGIFDKSASSYWCVSCIDIHKLSGNMRIICIYYVYLSGCS